MYTDYPPGQLTCRTTRRRVQIPAWVSCWAGFLAQPHSIPVTKKPPGANGPQSSSQVEMPWPGKSSRAEIPDVWGREAEEPVLRSIRATPRVGKTLSRLDTQTLAQPLSLLSEMFANVCACEHPSGLAPAGQDAWSSCVPASQAASPGCPPFPPPFYFLVLKLAAHHCNVEPVLAIPGKQ